MFNTIFKTGILFLFLVSVFTSCTNVAPGEEGFAYKPYGDGVDTSKIYKEGKYIGLGWWWNDMIRYSTRDQEITMNATVLEKNGLSVEVVVGMNFRMLPGKAPSVHLKYGPGYQTVFVEKILKGAIKEVIGKYEAEELYSTKRDIVETEMLNIVTGKLDNDGLFELTLLEVTDVNLPPPIAAAIVTKQEEVQNTLTAEQRALTATAKAKSSVAVAEGKASAAIAAAKGEAQAAAEQAKANRTLAASVTPNLLKLMELQNEADRIKKWNGKQPNVVAGESGLILQMKQE